MLNRSFANRVMLDRSTKPRDIGALDYTLL